MFRISLGLAAAACALLTATMPTGEAGAQSRSRAAQQAFRSDRIEVTTVGSGPDVVLIHGLASSAERAWRSTVAATPGHRYHLVQVKGFAGRPAEANASGLVAAPVAEEIARYIRTSNLRRPAVVGHSMGGTIGLMLAARHPQAVGRLMVVDMVPFLGAMFARPGATVADVRPVADQIRAGMSGPPNPQGEAMLVQMIDGMVRTEAARPAVLADSRASDRATSANSYHELITTDLRQELGAIRAPTTVLYVTPAGVPITDAQIDALYRTSYSGLTGVRLVRVPDAAHFIQIDAPERFRQELTAFLR